MPLGVFLVCYKIVYRPMIFHSRAHYFRKHMSVLDSLKDDDGDKGSTTQRSHTGTSSVKKVTSEVWSDTEPVKYWTAQLHDYFTIAQDKSHSSFMIK